MFKVVCTKLIKSQSKSGEYETSFNMYNPYKELDILNMNKIGNSALASIPQNYVGDMATNIPKLETETDWLGSLKKQWADDPLATLSTGLTAGGTAFDIAGKLGAFGPTAFDVNKSNIDMNKAKLAMLKEDFARKNKTREGWGSAFRNA